MSQPIFVFDTNILLTAMLSPRSQSNIAMGVAFRKGIIVYSDETLAELEKKIYLPKFDKYVSLSRRLMFYHRFAFTAFPINITTHIEACRDPKDDMFLELAKSADADCIVSKDKDLLVLHPFDGIPILDVPIFLNRFGLTTP